MAVFGMPAVHEDDALRAVRAGLAIRGRTRRLGEAAGLAAPLEVRIGIESGEAAMGRNPSGQMLVTGPVVNEAARLQSAARPGELAAGVAAAVVVLRGQPRSDTDTATFSPAAAIIGDLAGIDAGDPPDKIRRRLRELANRCCDPSEADLVAQRLALLFGLAERREEAAFVHDVQAGFTAIVDRLARGHPLVTVLADPHPPH